MLEWTYEGGFVNDRIEGSGVMVVGVGGKRTKGVWQAGKLRGEGSIEYPDGRLYQGNF